MKNFYSESDYKYTEIARVLSNFTYDEYVPCSILSLCPTMNKTDIVTKTINLTNNNLVNKDKNKIYLSTFKSCNYINIYIPSTYALRSEYDSDSGRYYGKKGSEFVLTFVGGNSNNFRVIARYDL